MNISRISRRLIVVLFIASIFVLTIANVMLICNDSSNESTVFIISKYIYPVIVAVLTLIYTYIKDKMYKLKINRKISLLYRYIYIMVIVIAAKIYGIFTSNVELSTIESVMYILISCLIAVNIKKIIFNVSKSDILSVLAVNLYSFIPMVIADKNIYLVSILMTMLFTFGLLYIQKLIDELKQQKIKNKKYIKYAAVVAVCFGFTIILGMNIYAYIPLIILVFVITYNLDKTNFNFPSNFIDKATSAQKDMMYKIERISISKLFVSVSIMIAITVVILVVSNYLFLTINIDNGVYNVVKNMQNYVYRLSLSSYNFSITSIYDNINILLNTSNMFYMFGFLYIIIVEILTMILKRRYDTKSTIIKILFMSFALMYLISFTNIYLYQNIFTALIVVISIVNTSNIYLNREERIKLLNA